LKHISGQTPSPSAALRTGLSTVPVRRQNKGIFLGVIDYGELFRSLTRRPAVKVTQIRTEDLQKNGTLATPAETITTLAPILNHPLALQPNQMARYEHCEPSSRTQKSNGSYIFLRQTLLNNFTFFVRPTDKLLTGSTEKRDGT